MYQLRALSNSHSHKLTESSNLLHTYSKTTFQLISLLDFKHFSKNLALEREMTMSLISASAIFMLYSVIGSELQEYGRIGQIRNIFCTTYQTYFRIHRQVTLAHLHFHFLFRHRRRRYHCPLPQFCILLLPLKHVWLRKRNKKQNK